MSLESAVDDDWRQRYRAYLSPRHPCVAPFCGGPSVYRNIACDVHWEILSDETRDALSAYIDQRHPRGGGISTIPEGLMATAYAADGATRREWRAFLRQDIEDGMYEDSPDIDRMRRHVRLSSPSSGDSGEGT